MMIYTKLNNARLKFHQLKLKKSGLNKFAGYSYFELADFLIPAMDVFSNHGLCAYISFGKDLATMKIVDVESGECIDITSPMSTAALKGCHEVKNLGAVQSYLRRYLWGAALEIVEHDALDSSKPLEPPVRAVYKTPIKQPSLQGIGDDLPPDVKNFLLELAESTNELCSAGNAHGALAMLKEQNLEGDQNIYLDRHLPSPVRSALRKAAAEAKDTATA